MLADIPAQNTATVADLTVRRAQQGDAGAFEQLYREHAGRVYGLCLRLSGDPGRAEELTQDVFVRCWEKLGSFQGKSAFSTWLHRLAVNVVLGDKRSEGVRVHRIFHTDEPEKYETAGRAGDPGHGMDLERAIAQLPPGARSVFVLHDVEGYKHEEIAEMHGSAVGTCKAQLHRARRLLREALER
ncbi:MAG TPA: RNA polymerase sigma factor [Longimicrobium sp.]|nr:RNA polymerase sigma factor [Longimicrobium sp.]